MRGILCALPCVSIFVLVLPAVAQNQDTAASLVLACDRAAASPSDTNRPAGIAGVPSDKLDPQIAIAACEAAATVAPNDPRIMFQLGRAHAAAKAYESARVQFSRASDLDYAAAQANLGFFYAAGMTGKPPACLNSPPGRAMPSAITTLASSMSQGVATSRRTTAKRLVSIRLPPTRVNLGGNTISAASIRTVAAD